MEYVVVHMFRGDVSIHGPFMNREDATQYRLTHFLSHEDTFTRKLKRLF